MKAGVNTFSPLHYLHLELEPGARFQTPINHSESAVYVAHGLIEIDDSKPLGHGQMAVLSKGAPSIVHALQPTTVMMLGGERWENVSLNGILSRPRRSGSSRPRPTGGQDV